MSAVRGACAQCRAAKAKCEYEPGAVSCNRCISRPVSCGGRSPGSAFQFRNENEVAQRNSQRARREDKGAIAIATPLEFLDPLSGDDGAEDDSDPELRGQFPWLNAKGLMTISEPLKRDVETRAIDRFFIDWTTYPYRHSAPGHFAELPMLYHNAPKDCVLTYAVRAIAFADMKNTRVNDHSFYLKACRNYGNALSKMRELASDDQHTSGDSVLAGLLLIDNFELMYLARTEPLGLHEAAVRHVLHLRGDAQLHSKASYHLWSLAHRRLQYKHMLTHEDPGPEEVEFMSKLNAKQPDIHFSMDVLHMNLLGASARKIMQTPASDAMAVIDQAEHLVRAMQSLINTMESWTSHLDDHWKPRKVNSDRLFAPNEVADGSYPSPPFLEDNVLEYQDIWFAAVSNFHAASQIVLRESMIDLINHSAQVWDKALSLNDQELVISQKKAIVDLSTSLMKTQPTLLGFSEEPASCEPYALHRGRMVGRNSIKFPALVVQRAHYTPQAHKDVAAKVMDWINVVHGLS